MTMNTVGAAAILADNLVHELLVLPALRAGVVAQPQLTTIVQIDRHGITYPRVTAEPSAEWVAEGAEITPTDSTLDELEVIPKKLAGLTIISAELANDSSPQAAAIVGSGLARDMARKMDAAFFGDLASPAPQGLKWLAAQAGANGVTHVIADAPFTSTDATLDSFASAMSAAEEIGVLLTGWATNPTTAYQLATLPASTDGSRSRLLGTDPTMPTRRMVEGLPLFVSPYIEPDVVWGLDATRVHLVLRSGAEVESDGSAFFTSDRIAVRAKMRLGYAFPHPLSVMRIEVPTS